MLIRSDHVGISATRKSIRFQVYASLRLVVLNVILFLITWMERIWSFINVSIEACLYLDAMAESDDVVHSKVFNVSSMLCWTFSEKSPLKKQSSAPLDRISFIFPSLPWCFNNDNLHLRSCCHFTQCINVSALRFHQVEILVEYIHFFHSLHFIFAPVKIK